MLIQLSVFHTLFRQGHVPLQIRFERDDVVVSLCKRFCNTTGTPTDSVQTEPEIPEGLEQYLAASPSGALLCR